MRKIKNYIYKKLLVKIFAETSASTKFSNKEASTITIFDAYSLYK